MRFYLANLTSLVLSVHALAQENPPLIPLVAQGAQVTQLAEGFIFTEGPACDAEGNVFFSDVRDCKTYKWSVDGKLSTFRENTLETNGMYFDADGNLICCEVVGRKVSRVTPDGKATTIVDQYDGKKFNSPNDVWIDPSGGFYFTDPRYRDMDGVEQDGFHVYYVAAGGTQAVRVIKDLVKPNGIVGTRDGKTLYVADHGDSKTYAYAITSPGRLGQRWLLTAHGSDGMTLDEQGNIYLTDDDVDVFNAKGEKVTTIEVPGKASNVVFGGKDRRTLFITANNRLYSVKMNVKGM
jgi:gluconolactonase